MLILEVLVNPKDLVNGWSEVYVGKDNQPRYKSNHGLIGEGARITRVRDAAEFPDYPVTDILYKVEARL